MSMFTKFGYFNKTLTFRIRNIQKCFVYLLCNKIESYDKSDD